MWIYSSYHKQLSAESLSFYSTKILSCSSLIPFNNSSNPLGPTMPLGHRPSVPERKFLIFSFWCILVYVSVVVSDMVIKLFCVLDFANRGFKKCLHMICCSVSFTLYIFPSALCASYFVIGFWRISTVSGLSSLVLESLLDRCAELLLAVLLCKTHRLWWVHGLAFLWLQFFF